MVQLLNGNMIKRYSRFFPSLLLVAVVSLMVFAAGCNKKEAYHSPYFETLDSLMNYSDEFKLERLTRIAELRQKKKTARSISDLYMYNTLLFNFYLSLNGDSALHYADLCIENAKSTQNKEWLTQSLINKANTLAATGLLKQALDIMNSINRESLTEVQLVDYYGQMIYLYSHLGNYTGGNDNDYYVTERLYKDSIMQVIKPDHPQYLWYKGWDLLGTNQNLDSIIKAYTEWMDESDLKDREDAKDAYILARLYKQKGDIKIFEKYMTLAACIDVRIANSDIAALDDLADYVFNNGNGDVDRAYDYITYSLNRAINYPNRAKAFVISGNLEQISAAYRDNLYKQQRHTYVFLILVCILSLILIIAIIAIVKQNKNVKEKRNEVDRANEELNLKVKALSEVEEKLNSANQQLQQLNSDLKEKNSELYEANFVKEEYIGYVFKLWSTFIAQMEDLKRNIYLKAMKKQWQEIELATADLDMKEELKEFYHSFDTIFLNLYPNFVSDFNSLLEPDKQITLKEGELLNMELRIYALIRLGITDSVKIADFLHCAPQTVYNYRLRARTRSQYTKTEFLSQVRSIGHFAGR